MTDYAENLNAHYGQADLIEQILDALKREGKDISQLTRDDLATFEEFHIGGREATLRTATLGELKEGAHVLDIGCGIGGPARTLAAEFGCQVTGIDITAEYCRAAERLTKLVGMEDALKFQQANALDLPFDADSFDAVWIQHVNMNIAEKDRLYSGIKRVLKPNGRLLFHEIFKGNAEALIYPVFWAEEPSMSFLRPAEEIRSLLTALGFVAYKWNDVTADALAWFENVLATAKSEGPPSLGMQVIVKKDAPLKAANVTRNLADGKIAVIQAVMDLTKQ